MWTQIAKFMGPTWGPSGSCWPQMGPMLAPWTLLSGDSCEHMLPTDQYEYGLTQGSLPPVIALLWCRYDRIRSHKIWQILVYENTKCKEIIQSGTLLEFWFHAIHIKLNISHLDTLSMGKVHTSSWGSLSCTYSGMMIHISKTVGSEVQVLNSHLLGIMTLF